MEITASSFSSQFIQILDKIGQQLGIVIDWTSANVTPYLTDLISRYTKFIIFENGFWTLVSLILLLAGIIFVKNNFKTAVSSLSTYECSIEEVIKTILWFAGITFIIIGIIMTFVNVPNFIKSIYIPEYYILQSVKGLI